MFFQKERAKSLARAVSGEAQHFESLANFQPENGAILANATPIGMHPSTDRIPAAEVLSASYSLHFITRTEFHVGFHY
jgi:3-dehydroquinate dehydratase/shikimate dehydrogenase